MATRYAVASGDWSNTTSVWSDTDGGAPGSFVPVDGDTFVILTAVNVKMDVSHDGWTGLAGDNIIRGGATPGMLYWSDGDSGHLKLRSAATLQGTLDTNRGRLLANSNGTWGTTTALANADKAVIEFGGTTTPAQIVGTNLDIALYCTQPTNTFVHVYGTKYDFDAATGVNTSTDVIDFGSTTPPSQGTLVSFYAPAGSTLPTGLQEELGYYVRNVVSNTCKVAYTNDDSTAADITVVGSGTCSMMSGHTSTSTATVNVIEDVTSDAPWSTSTGYNRVTLVDALAPTSYDQQRATLSTINATTLVLSANVDSSQWPSARVYLSSRNVSIRSSGTSNSYALVAYVVTDTHGGVFQCELVHTAGTGTTYYGYGISYNTGCTISGTICGCNHSLYYGVGHTMSGVILSGSTGCNLGRSHTISGTVAGCGYAVSNSNGCTISGLVTGCTAGINLGGGNTMSGNIRGCDSGLYQSIGNIVTGTMNNCGTANHTSSGTKIRGTLLACTYGFYECSDVTVTGTICGLGSTIRFPVGLITVKSGATVDEYTFYDRNTVGTVGRISVEDYDGTANDHRAFDAFGDVIRTACDGTGDAPSEDPDGTNGDCIAVNNLQSNLSSLNPLVIIPSHRIWMTAAAHTVTYKVQTTFAAISAGNLKLWCSYISTASPVARTITSNAPAIDQRDDNTDWSQTLAVTFTPAAAGWVDFSMELYEYESGNEVYVWPTPTIT